MQHDPNNPPTVARAAGKRCPDCGQHRPASAFYVRPNGQLSAYCRSHQRDRARASYRRRRQDPATLARMRQADRIRKRASRTRQKALGATREASLTRSRARAARRLIAAHPEEYRALLAAERAPWRVQAGEGGGWHAA
jgi:hypothetical protein